MQTTSSTKIAALSAAALFAAAGSAFAADYPLEFLNAGPSSDQIPTANGDPVATILAPREIVNPDVTTVLPADLDEMATAVQVEGDDTVGIRNRSAAILPFADIDGTELVVQADLDYDADSEFSFLIFLTEEAAENIATVADLVAFIDNDGVPGVDFIALELDNDLGVPDADLTEANLTIGGLVISAADIFLADPDVANFPIALFLFDEDAAAGGEIVTEYINVRQDSVRAQAEVVALADSNDEIVIVTNQPLITDGGAGVVNYDTNPAGLALSDFRIQVDGAGASTGLDAYLGGLDNPIALDGAITVTGDFNNIITIPLDDSLAGGDLTTFLNSRIGFASSTSGGDIRTFAGEIPANNLPSFAQVGRADDLTIADANLLQGTGQAGFGNGTQEVWVAIDFSDTVTDVGDADQFELVNASGDVVAVSDAVQSTLPTNVQVLGIDDADLDGTADDNVIDTDGARLFARFVLVDGDDSINSDGTWSDEGQDDFERSDREALSVRLAEGFVGTPASNLLGGAVDAESTFELGDMARPMAIGFRTFATGGGEFVDRLDIIFDETVGSATNTAIAIGIDEGATIADLTTGLNADLSIPTATVATLADFADEVFQGTELTGLASAMTFVSNDTVTVNAPALPLDGTANDGSSSILAGTGDTPYFLALVNGAVTDGDLGAFGFGDFDGDDALQSFVGAADVEDGAAPALVNAFASDTDDDGELDEILAGFSEDVNLFNDEAESYFAIMDADGRRHAIPDADIDDVDDNVVEIDLGDNQLDTDVDYTLSVFNPGFSITDDAGNAVDPNVAKTRMIDITPPGAMLEEEGRAFVDPDTDKVTRIVIRATGEVDLSEGGSVSELANRFFIRGDDFGGDFGNAMELAGFIDDIEFDDEANGDGTFDITLFLMEGMELSQDDFFVEYVSAADNADLGDTTLVTFEGGQAIGSETIFVQVLRPSVNEGDDLNDDGNPLTMTIVGTVNLNGADALGTEVEAFIHNPDGGVGTLTWTYRGVVHTTTVSGITNGQSLWFHPQLIGDGGEGTVEPMGILNGKSYIDITATVSLTTESNDGDGVNGENASESYEREVLLYQNLGNLPAGSILQPVQLTFRADPSVRGRFTVTGSGITNGSVTFPGEFVSIGSTLVTGAADDNGARPFTLHTRGEQGYNGRGVVVVVTPDAFFNDDDDDAQAFLANNLVANRLTFMSDINRTGSSATPVRFDINSANVEAYELDEYVQDFWALLPVTTNQGAFGSAIPNRFLLNNQPVANASTFPTGTDARGAFVYLNKATGEPTLLNTTTALAIDSRGLYVGALRGLTRVVGGYAYGVEYDGTPAGGFDNYCWFTFGTDFPAGASLTVGNAGGNGGWNLVANTTNSSVTPGNFAGTVNMTMMAERGVRIWAGPTFADFNDLEAINPDEAVLLYTGQNDMVP